ncbi:unnamed protein product [Soboliphyme baturini]|uniref:CUB domain-containing protein n=1 Tax=Soboliphyme baturini TaxID=241478 RepID=A0A183IAQ2_9BILA|nr:unnamed protein product [Soboliphyme baturini]
MDKLHACISPNALPPCYGGTMYDDHPMIDPHTCCTKAQPVRSEDFFIPSHFPEVNRTVLKCGAVFSVPVTVNEKGSRLLWQFSVSGRVEFAVL